MVKPTGHVASSALPVSEASAAATCWTHPVGAEPVEVATVSGVSLTAGGPVPLTPAGPIAAVAAVPVAVPPSPPGSSGAAASSLPIVSPPAVATGAARSAVADAHSALLELHEDWAFAQRRLQGIATIMREEVADPVRACAAVASAVHSWRLADQVLQRAHRQGTWPMSRSRSPARRSEVDAAVLSEDDQRSHEPVTPTGNAPDAAATVVVAGDTRSCESITPVGADVAMQGAASSSSMPSSTAAMSGVSSHWDFAGLGHYKLEAEVMEGRASDEARRCLEEWHSARALRGRLSVPSL